MVTYFLDSSAIVKYYINEPGSTWIRTIVNSEIDRCIICTISIAEVASAIAQVQRSTMLSKKRMRQSYLKFRSDVRRGLFLAHAVNLQALDFAAELALKYPLKGFDATQVASALLASSILDQSVVFVSGDKQALNAAKNEGLYCENPFEHVATEEAERQRK